MLRKIARISGSLTRSTTQRCRSVISWARAGYPQRRDEPAGVRALLYRFRHATCRIQLLGTWICLPRVETTTADQAPCDIAGFTAFRTELGAAVRTALDNDVRVEILLPDPESPCSQGIAQRLGVEPGLYRRLFSLLLDDLHSASRAAGSGHLDLRFYTEPATLSIVRCDEWLWASLSPDGASETPDYADYLEVDQDCENGRALQAYFDRLYTTSGLPWHGHKAGAARDSRRRARAGPSRTTRRFANAQGPPSLTVLDTSCRSEADALVELEGSARW